jgi:DNA-binding NtrC family response regulator
LATRRVLVVDDEPDVVDTLSDIVRAMRYTDTLEVEGASDGAQGLDAILRQVPDLVLLDLHMAGLSGLALLKQIRQVAPRLPVIVVTGTKDTSEAAEALQLGAVAYLPKPFSLRYVEALVATFLDSSKRPGIQ